MIFYYKIPLQYKLFSFCFSPFKLPSDIFKYVTWHELEEHDVQGSQICCPRVRKGRPITLCNLHDNRGMEWPNSGFQTDVLLHRHSKKEGQFFKEAVLTMCTPRLLRPLLKHIVTSEFRIIFMCANLQFKGFRKLKEQCWLKAP